MVTDNHLQKEPIVVLGLSSPRIFLIQPTNKQYISNNTIVIATHAFIWYTRILATPFPHKRNTGCHKVISHHYRVRSRGGGYGG